MPTPDRGDQVFRMVYGGMPGVQFGQVGFKPPLADEPTHGPEGAPSCKLIW